MPFAAIVEDTGKIGNIYQSKGYQIEVLDPRAILFSKSRITKQIRRGQFDSVWIHGPVRGRHVHVSKFSACIDEVAKMLVAAEDYEVPCMLLSAFGNMWHHPLLNQIANRLKWNEEELSSVVLLQHPH